MIKIRSLSSLNLSDLKRVASGYWSDSKYVIAYTSAEDRVTFEIQPTVLDKLYIKKFEHDEDTIQRYERVLRDGFSFGAYEGNLLIGFVVSESHEWNSSLWVWEFHVLEAYHNRKIGKRLMEQLAEKAKGAGFRTIVCETQNTNVSAIKVYRKLGFELEGIDISYYSNNDYPDGEIAFFMKRRSK